MQFGLPYWGLEGGSVKLSVRDVLGIVCGVALFYFYVSNTRPVGWFDSVVGLVLFFVGVYFVKNFKGFKSK